MNVRVIATALTSAVSVVVLAGCGTSTSSHADATINVHVGLFAAFQPKGEEATIGLRQPNKVVTVSESNGRTRQGRTNSQGRIVFTVPPGQYLVAAEGCQPEHVDAASGGAVAVNIICQGF